MNAICGHLHTIGWGGFCAFTQHSCIFEKKSRKWQFNLESYILNINILFFLRCPRTHGRLNFAK